MKMNRYLPSPRKKSAKYRGIVGTLLYHVVKTRADLDIAVSKLESQEASSTEGDIKAAKCALRYSQGAMNLNLQFDSRTDTQINTYVGANWAEGTKGKRRSRSKTLIRYGKATIFAGSAFQKYITLSLTETK